jgi:hypothetical protein
MKKITLYILTALVVAVSCSQKAEYDQTLGLLSRYNILAASGGSTQVAVFSNTSWSVEMDPPVSWASIDRFEGYKSGYLVFDYEINYGRARRVKLIFKAGDQTRTLDMYQSPYYSDSECKLELGGSDSIDAPASGMTVVIPFTTNLIYQLDEMFLTLVYPEGEEPETPWIILKSVELDNICIEIAPNTTGADRVAHMRLSHTDAGSYDSTEGDTVSSNTINVSQTK